MNYKLDIEGMKTSFFPPTALQRHKSCLHPGLFNPRDSKMREFVFRVNDIVEYLKHVFPLIKYKRLTEDVIIELIKFSLTCECKNQLPMQVFGSTANSLNFIVEFYKWLTVAKVIFCGKGYGSHPH